MKKIFILLLVALMLVSMFACKKTNDEMLPEFEVVETRPPETQPPVETITPEETEPPVVEATPEVPEVQYVSKEFICMNSSLTSKDFDGIDFDKFVALYELTEESFADGVKPGFFEALLSGYKLTLAIVNGEVDTEPTPEVVEPTDEPIETEEPNQTATAIPNNQQAVTQPTKAPTAVPTQKPTSVPTQKPTSAPTQKPTSVPTQKPTSAPTQKPTSVPTQKPTAAPTQKPTSVPTQKPTATPTVKPTNTPTPKPTNTPIPTATPYVQESEPSVNIISGKYSKTDSANVIKFESVPGELYAVFKKASNTAFSWRDGVMPIGGEDKYRDNGWSEPKFVTATSTQTTYKDAISQYSSFQNNVTYTYTVAHVAKDRSVYLSKYNPTGVTIKQGGSSGMEIAEGEELMGSFDSEKEAKNAAALYGINFVKYGYKMATFHPNDNDTRTLHEIIELGKKNGWPLLEINYVVYID